MKKAIKILFAFLLMLITILGSFAAEKNSKPEIKTVDNYVAVFDFEVTTGDKGISRPLADSVIHEFSRSDKYEVIDRGNMNKILKEQKFQMSGCVAQECKVEAGQILGVGKIVSGSVGLVGKTYYLTLQLIDVQTGKIELSEADKCKCELDELLDSTTRLAKKLLSEKVDQSATTEPKPANLVESKAEEIAMVKTKSDAIAKSTGTELKITNSIGMTFVYIKAGTFMMGSPSGEPERNSDETQHQVTLTKNFYMQTTEVTQGQWRAIMGNIPSYFNNCGDECPVENVSWNDVQEFIVRLNRKEVTNNYRLPTEAEWEYAARSGGNEETYSGTDSKSNLEDYAWYRDNSNGRTHSVKQKKPNDLGLYDMSGNVWEWVQDWYGRTYPPGNVTDPVGPLSGAGRVFRGGGWGSGSEGCRSAGRDNFATSLKGSSIGFRLINNVVKPPEPKLAQASIAIAPSAVSSSAKETARDGRFIAYSNGTVLDTKTNLMWAAMDNGSSIKWENAKIYCENYRGGGYTNWRIPMQDELAGLYDASKSYSSDCGYDVHLTELIRLSCAWAWASEARGSDAAIFVFGTGGRHWFRQSHVTGLRALPVRSGK